MEFWVGVTDRDWYEFLSAKKPDEVNFWKPSGKTFAAINAGAPFLFKLKGSSSYIVGGGFFVRYSILPLSLAWQAFGEKNGTADYNAFWHVIARLNRNQSPNPLIGCSIITEPFFFPQSEWIPIAWNPNIVQGKKYSTTSEEGHTIWSKVAEKIKLDKTSEIISPALSMVAEPHPQYAAEYSTKTRLGQGAFRVLVTDSYHRRCAITGERTLPVLEAAHIKPFSESGPNMVSNGILLRSDLHILFDRGYLTVTDNLHVEVSGRIKEEFENGHDYYAMHGKRLIALPDNMGEHPAKEFIRWHNENIYRDKI